MLPRPDSREIRGTERLRIPSVAPPRLPGLLRIQNFDEVHQPWTPEMATVEASRCLHCPGHPCVAACPLQNDIPGALWLVEHGAFSEAAAVFRKSSNLSDICSRTCCQDHQCESACPHAKAGMRPVAVGSLERFLADRYRKEEGWHRSRPPCTGHRVAVVGAGPAGLTVAELLAEKGHCITVFDQWPGGGGRLRYKTPRFKLDHALVRRRLELLRELGVEFIFDTRVCGEEGIQDLFTRGFEALFLGTGSNHPVPPGIPGHDLEGVHDAISFLVRANVEQNNRPSEWEDPPEVGESVVVIGGGEVAMDCCRTALRLGASSVSFVPEEGCKEDCRSPTDEILAREEGAELHWYLAPLEVLSDAKGRVRGVRCRPPSGTAPSFDLQANTVVIALGSRPDPDLGRGIRGLETRDGGMLVVDPSTGRTPRKGIWAGGENVTGPSPVASAVAQARAAAADIHLELIA